jgi:hypothetical protein
MIFTDLPDTALAAILSGFCDGKTISTLALNVVSSSRGSHGPRFWNLCRNVLVERYVRLSSGPLRAYEEIRDVLDITREDIRLSTNDEDDSIVTKFSYWCGILDYFETQLHIFQQQQQQQDDVAAAAGSSKQQCLRRRREPQWIVWRGTMTLPTGGEIEAYLTTPHWTVGAMRFWKQMEQENVAYCRPSPQNFVFRQPPIDDSNVNVENQRVVPYGTLFAVNAVSQRRLAYQCGDLSIDGDFDGVPERHHWRHALIPLSQLYNDPDNEPPGIVLVDHGFVSRTYTSYPVGPLLVGTNRSSLCVCWNKEQGEDDWEMAHARLGEICVQIMQDFSADNDDDDDTPSSFRDVLLHGDYVQANEFGNC